jgi:hypothetical protein
LSSIEWLELFQAESLKSMVFRENDEYGTGAAFSAVLTCAGRFSARDASGVSADESFG